MGTYLLTWNAKLFPWDDLADDMEELRTTGTCLGNWSCGRVKNIAPGSRFFMIRQGIPPKGIVASGRITSRPDEGEKWDNSGATTMYVEVAFDQLGPGPRVRRDELDSPRFQPFKWDAQMSGTKIPDRIATAFERLWRQRRRTIVTALPGEIDRRVKYPEGTTTAVRVDAYERNARARRACIEHYGYECAVCGFSFGRTYGRDAIGHIHVHHLQPLAALRKRHRVDAIADMRPVCANCHAFIHLRTPPYTLREVRKALAERSE